MTQNEKMVIESILASVGLESLKTPRTGSERTNQTS